MSNDHIKHTSKFHEWIGPLTSAYVFWCPACEGTHTFTVYHDSDKGWKFDGNIENPTFSPSLLYPDKAVRCHLFLQNGKINYCNDCGHKLNGMTDIDMAEMPEDAYSRF